MVRECLTIQKDKCLIYGPNFNLLPHTLGRTRVGIQTHKIVLPAIQNIITADEKEFFRNIYIVK